MQINIGYDDEFGQLLTKLKGDYGDAIFEIEGIGSQLDISSYSKNYFSKHATNTVTADNSVDENSNVNDMSSLSYITEVSKPLLRLNSLYMLWKYTKKYYNTDLANTIMEHQINGDIYINDFHHFFLVPYCFNYSTYDIAMKGLPYLQTPKCVPSKYLLTFKQQLEQFLVYASNNQSGASGIADLLIIMSFFVKKILETSSDMHFKLVDTEENKWAYIKDVLTTFIYTINQPFKSNQSIFSNISIYDKYFLEEFKNNIIFNDGSTPDIAVVQKLQEVYLDIMNEELDRTLLTFPVTTACFSIDDDNNIEDEEFCNMIANKNLKYAFKSLYFGTSSTISACCRLRSDSNNEYFNSFGAGKTKLGSLGVVTLNLPRMSKLSNSEDEFIDKVEYFTRIANKINNIKRHIIKIRIDNGNLPMYTHKFMELDKQYNTTGINGINEALYFQNKDVLNSDGQDLQFRIIKKVNDINHEYSKKYNCPVNTEQTPSENSAVKNAKKDKCLGIQDEFELYSNQFIPLTTNADLLDRINLQGKFDKEFTGGAIAHINIDDKIDNVDSMVKIIKLMAKKGVIYAAINYNLQQCENGHMSVGKSGICEHCGSTNIQNITRVVGFLVPVRNFNKTRREHDYPKRQFYNDIETKENKNDQ